MTSTVVQHGTCQRRSITSGILYVSDGRVQCSRGCEDVPTLVEMSESLDPGDSLTVNDRGMLHVVTGL